MPPSTREAQIATLKLSKQRLRDARRHDDAAATAENSLDDDDARS